MIVIPNKRALVVKTRNPGALLTLIPSSKSVKVNGQEYVAVPHRLDEARVLTNLGMAPPSPIRYQYKWSGSYTPFKAQMDTAEFLTLHPRSFVLNEMGTGKTLAALWAFDYLRNLGVLHRMIVVCPLSTMERTWADEVFRHFSHLDYAVLHGSRDKRIKLLKRPADVYIINHDGLKIIADELKDRGDIDIVISDEIAQAARNASTDRWRALNQIINKQQAGARWCWGMTGTPTPNNPTDAWAQCKLVNPSSVPQYFTRFKDMVMKQVNQFLWVPRTDATEVVHRVMQPAIRFSRAECVDLPPCLFQTRQVELTNEQRVAYKAMLNKLKAEIGGGEVLAVNEAVKTSKLVQIACLAGGTEVLTDSGWLPIERVRPSLKVWDGEEWVAQKGAVCNGFRTTIDLDGVSLTDDHLVMTASGWAPAKEVKNGRTATGRRLDRATVRLPDGAAKSSSQFEWMRSMGMRLRLWSSGVSVEPILAKSLASSPPSLRLRTRQQEPRDVAYAAVQHLDTHAATLPRYILPGLRTLWRQGGDSVREMGRFVRSVLGGHATRIQRGAVAGPHRQQRPLRPWELSMGYAYPAGQEQAVQTTSGNTQTIERNRDSGLHTIRSSQQRLAPTAVYDLVDCGPRNRFVVRGKSGELMLVHNCGVAYDKEGDEVTLDSSPRLDVVKEIVDGAEGKVIVFVPFVSAVRHVAGFLRQQGLLVECIYGEVSKSERDRIFGNFQNDELTRVIVAQPAAMSHGLTLTKANTIIWYAPIFSNDIYDQACARITRPGQQLSQLIVNIEGSPVERRMYERLQNKQKMQGLLLTMVEDGRIEITA